MWEQGLLRRFVGPKRGFFLCFILGFTVRLIPEVLSYPYPIGYDTVHYGAMVKGGVVWNHWSEVFSTWLLYAILVPVHKVVGGDPFLLLKVVAPTLYALNVCGIYFFAKEALHWNVEKALVTSFFFTFLLASLRMSWDLYRNMLGMAILLFTLPRLRDLRTKNKFMLFVLLSVLVVFSHEYASVTLFTVVLGIIIKDLLKGEKREASKVLLAAIPASILFLSRICLIFFPVPFQVETNFINAVKPTARPGGLFFLINYLNISHQVQQYSTYLNLATHVLFLFITLYLIYLPLIFVGFFRDSILDSWTLLLFVGSFSSLVTPFCALDWWDRWMYMLVYPFTFYIAMGIRKSLGLLNGLILAVRWVKIFKWTMRGVLLSTVLFGLVFIIRGTGFFSNSNINMYFPSTMLHNTVPLSDVRGVVEAINWVNEYTLDDSCVLTHQALLSWSRLYLEKSHWIVYFVDDVGRALNVASENGFDPVYLVWWNEDIGWHGFMVPEESFSPVFSSGRISVFRHNS